MMAADEMGALTKAISVMMERMEQVFLAQTETMQGLNETLVKLSKAVSEQHISKTQAEAMEELNKTVSDLSGTVSDLSKAVEELPKAEKDYIHENDWKDIEEEEAWETVRDTAKEQEKETVESWKDELNNLLVFAGLFSAVVTAFTVESYTWLQQDPRDVSNALLARLSLQLTVFMITFAGSPPSSAFANSTTPALSIPTVESSFLPVSYAIPVNTLWVLSLTLSLISAFFAITAQQWLRQLRLPPEMPVRRAVQLLATRKDGLTTWQVPSIIALLPLLVQIAVIFFLIGLFLLLQSLNATVTITFGAVAVVGLLTFLVTTVIPLITPHCPYRSPVVPTAVVVFQCLSYPLALTIMPVVFFVRALLDSPPGQQIVHSLPGRGFYIDIYVRDFFDETLLPYLVSFGRHFTVDTGQFWLSRECRYIFRDELGKASLERASLIQTFLSTPARHSSKVYRLVHSSECSASFQGVRDTVVNSLRVFRTGLKWSDIIPQLAVDPNMAPYVLEWFSARHHRLLWQYFQQRDWQQDEIVQFIDSQCLIVFHELDNTFPATRRRYVKHLLQICARQVLPKYCLPSETVPGCLVLGMVLNRGYVPDDDDATTLLGFTTKVYRNIINLCPHNNRRLCIVSTALALIAANKSETTDSASITSTVNLLADALNENEMKQAAVFELQWYYEKATRWSQHYSEVMSPARIMEALCEALFNYAATPLLSPSPEHLRALTRISASLRYICTGRYGNYASGRSYAERSEMQAACSSLDKLNTQLERITTESILKDPSDVPVSGRTDFNESPNDPSPSAAAISTAHSGSPVLVTDEATETNEEHASLHSGAPTSSRNSLLPPSAVDNTDTDPATFGNDSTVSSALMTVTVPSVATILQKPTL